MRIPSGAASRPHRLTCLFCESGESLSLGQGFVRCDSCGMLLIGSTLEVLHDVVGLPDALGSRPCANAETPRCAICPTGCSTARRAAQRSCPSRWIDAVTTEYRAPSPLGPTRPRTTEERRSIRTPTNHPRGDPKMRESMFDVQVWKQHREEITREVRQNRLAKVLRNSRKRLGPNVVPGVGAEEDRRTFPQAFECFEKGRLGTEGASREREDRLASRHRARPGRRARGGHRSRLPSRDRSAGIHATD
jgi:hypothetical protein